MIGVFSDNCSDQENMLPPKSKKINSLEISALRELFICPKCTKTYRLKHSLTRHIRFECGKEPMYACRFCSRRFKHKYDLNVHFKSKHLNVPIKKRPKALSSDSIDLAQVLPK